MIKITIKSKAGAGARNFLRFVSAQVKSPRRSILSQFSSGL